MRTTGTQAGSAPAPITELIAICAPPSMALVAEVHNLIEAATRDQYEAFRYQTAEALKSSGAANTIMHACLAWAERVVAEGRFTQEQAALSAFGGMIASAFQLGLLAATATEMAAAGANVS